MNMFRKAIQEAKHGMNFEDEFLEELTKAHKKAGAKSTGKINGWRMGKGASVPGNYTTDGTIPTQKSPKELLKASSRINHVFWLEMKDGSAIVSDPGYSSSWITATSRAVS